MNLLFVLLFTVQVFTTEANDANGDSPDIVVATSKSKFGVGCDACRWTTKYFSNKVDDPNSILRKAALEAALIWCKHVAKTTPNLPNMTHQCNASNENLQTASANFLRRMANPENCEKRLGLCDPKIDRVSHVQVEQTMERHKRSIGSSLQSGACSVCKTGILFFLKFSLNWYENWGDFVEDYCYMFKYGDFMKNCNINFRNYTVGIPNVFAQLYNAIPLDACKFVKICPQEQEYDTTELFGQMIGHLKQTVAKYGEESPKIREILVKVEARAKNIASMGDLEDFLTPRQSLLTYSYDCPPLTPAANLAKKIAIEFALKHFAANANETAAVLAARRRKRSTSTDVASFYYFDAIGQHEKLSSAHQPIRNREKRATEATPANKEAAKTAQTSLVVPAPSTSNPKSTNKGLQKKRAAFGRWGCNACKRTMKFFHNQAQNGVEWYKNAVSKALQKFCMTFAVHGAKEHCKPNNANFGKVAERVLHRISDPKLCEEAFGLCDGSEDLEEKHERNRRGIIGDIGRSLHGGTCFVCKLSVAFFLRFVMSYGSIANYFCFAEDFCSVFYVPGLVQNCNMNFGNYTLGIPMFFRLAYNVFPLALCKSAAACPQNAELTILERIAMLDGRLQQAIGSFATQDNPRTPVVRQYIVKLMDETKEVRSMTQLRAFLDTLLGNGEPIPMDLGVLFDKYGNAYNTTAVREYREAAREFALKHFSDEL